MQDVSHFVGNSDGAKATTSYLNEELSLAAQLSPLNLNQNIQGGDRT